MTPRERIFVALDTPERERALELAEALRGRVGGLKVGLELFASEGPPLVRTLARGGVPVFLDLKLHDIPATVAGAAAAAARTGAALLTVHALGGAAMIARAVEGAAAGAAEARLPAPTVLAVTVLTSHSGEDLAALGIAGSPQEAVLRLAGQAWEAGARGIVCSPREVAAVRALLPDALLVVPGIRPAGSAAHDQARVATPAAALADGADRLVVGRPITGAADPAAAAEAIAREIAGAALA